MKAIKVTTPRVSSIELARNMLEIAQGGRDFLFGYVDESAFCCIYFQQDISSVRPLRPDEQRVELATRTLSQGEAKNEACIPWHAKYATRVTRGDGDFRDAPMESFDEK